MDNPDAISKMLLAPFHHIADVPGKGVRTAMVDAFNQWIKAPPAVVAKIQEVAEMLHNASLLIDDIEDDSQLRRGIPVAHNVFGIAATINSANYVYFAAMDKLLKISDCPERTAKLMNIFSTEMCNLHSGQGRDIYYRENGYIPTEDEYRSMVHDKTAGLFRLIVKLLQCFSDCSIDFTGLLNHMGFYYQVLDDYLNLSSAKYFQNKSFCEDITEGKFSFVVLHSIREGMKQNDNRLLKIIRQHTTDHELKKYCLKLMKGTGSFAYTLDMLKRTHRELLEMIDNIPGGNPMLVKMLGVMHNQLEVDGKEECSTPF